ncbi:MAG: (2Fe-2S) ferredoxin domain-containing protein [Peptococcia bacterium]|jgi:NADP-reducing hydrogenase subunit HndB
MRSLDELKKLKAKTQKEISTREKTGKPTIIVHMGTCGIANGAREVLNAALAELKERNLTDIHVTQTGCPGLCHLEPLVTISEPEKKPCVYGKVSVENMKRIILQHVVNGQPVTEWLVNLEK